MDLVTYVEKATKYDFLFNYLMFHIENSKYLDKDEIAKILNGLEPKEKENEEEGENNE